MEDLGRILTVALAVLSIATAAGLGLQRAAVTSLRERLKDSDEELARVNRRLTERDAELVVVRGDLAALARVVTGEAHWIAIGQKLDEHHGDAETHWTEEKTLLEEIRDRMPPAPTTPRT